MGVPKQRHTKSRRNRRRSHHALKERSFPTCAKCGFAVMSHHVCQNCGTYANREVIDVMKKLTKKEKKTKEKELDMADLSKK
ncbi:50S ribosomal protein L32 [Patescibacteria group bacterium]|nr:50S ribosomal protein L32 [Patescibacteria group bacterium]MCG2695635.1 50S ribosomal protein L32 [Candidatus Parcubacteria bacterium]MCG2809173.1 50S ribosomal protein L32 [Candidatus Portnoybacteria bacterium]